MNRSFRLPGWRWLALLAVVAAIAIGVTARLVFQPRRLPNRRIPLIRLLADPPPPAPPAAAPPPSELNPATGDGATGPVAPLPSAAPTSPATDPLRQQAYDSLEGKTVLDLQRWRRVETLSYTAADGTASTAALINLNPAVGEWYLLALEPEGGAQRFYHLETTQPSTVLHLDPAAPNGLRIEADGQVVQCALWGSPVGALEAARASGHTYAALCGQRLALRNPARGHRSTLERATDFLRDNIWGGEQLTVFVRDTIYADAYLSTGELDDDGGSADSGPATAAGGPPPAALDPAVAGRHVDLGDYGLPLDQTSDGRVLPGAWYPVAGAPGMYGGVIQPRFVDPAIAVALGERVDVLDEVEQSAFVYLLAYDLAAFEIGYEMGTDHPRVEWSDRAPGSVRPPGLPGPDGFEADVPLVRTGQVDPALVPRLVATMAGGFKRSHGAFKTGALSTENLGSHYGFLSHGVEVSKLQPGLSTIIGFVDGQVDVVTWRADMAADMWRMRFARQNGVPILERDPASGQTVPGAMLTAWAAGNWSGSVDGKLRSVRGGLCRVEDARGSFLLYAYFSSATPSAMAQVFAAYGCRDAMLTDMNALEHTYMAAYLAEGGGMGVHQLVHGMEVLDLERKGVLLPRFVGMPDNRDFFYVLRREAR